MLTQLLTAAAENGEEVAETTFDLAQHLTEQQGTVVFIIGCVVVLSFLGAVGAYIYKKYNKRGKRR